jgi:hypothetical protein
VARIHRQQVEDVGPVLAVLIVVAHQPEMRSRRGPLTSARGLGIELYESANTMSVRFMRRPSLAMAKSAANLLPDTVKPS